MAFGLTVDTSFRYPATYWKVRTVSGNNDGGQAVISMEVIGYKDRAAREDVNGAPMAVRTFQATLESFSAVTAPNMFQQAYLWLKANVPFWADAVDLDP